MILTIGIQSILPFKRLPIPPLGNVTVHHGGKVGFCGRQTAYEGVLIFSQVHRMNYLTMCYGGT